MENIDSNAADLVLKRFLKMGKIFSHAPLESKKQKNNNHNGPILVKYKGLGTYNLED